VHWVRLQQFCPTSSNISNKWNQ